MKQITFSNGEYSASFVGDPDQGGHWLRVGNIDQEFSLPEGNDHVIDIVDYGALLNQYNTVYGYTDTGCSEKPVPHADVNGDGVVVPDDYNAIAGHFFKESEPNCCGQPYPLALGGVASDWARGRITLRPVTASGSHVLLDTNKIGLYGGAQRLFLEVSVRDWDYDVSGSPLLRNAQAVIDPAGYQNSTGGALVPSPVSCTTTAECEAAFGAGADCGYTNNPNTCTPAFQDFAHTDFTGPDWVHACCAYTAGVDLSSPASSYGYFSSTPPGTGAPGGGPPDYLGTLVLDVPANASGTYVLGFDPAASFLLDENLNPIQHSLVAAEIIVHPPLTGQCCYDNGGAVACADSLTDADCHFFFDAPGRPAIWSPWASCSTSACECTAQAQCQQVPSDDLCISDFCHPVLGACLHQPIPGWNNFTACCNGSNGQQATIQSPDPCQFAHCSLPGNRGNLVLTPRPPGWACDDGNPCTAFDVCGGGPWSCVGQDINSIACNVDSDCPAPWTPCISGFCLCTFAPELGLDVAPSGNPDPLTFDCGAPLSMTLHVAATPTPLNGGQYVIAYDPVILESAAVSSNGPYTNVLWQTVNAMSGLITVAAGVPLGGFDGPNGNADLLELSFNTVGGGYAQVCPWWSPLVPITRMVGAEGFEVSVQPLCTPQLFVRCDRDGDAILDHLDNCPLTVNPLQDNADADSFGDLCDACPANAANMCRPGGTISAEVEAAVGATVATPNGEITLEIDPGDLPGDMTISITTTSPQSPTVDVLVGTGTGFGSALGVYNLSPDGVTFNSPVTITLVVDVTDLTPAERSQVTLYLLNETTQMFEEVPGAICSVVENPPGTFLSICTAEIPHFSAYALIYPADSDQDGVPDNFGEIDNCPLVANPGQQNTDGDPPGDACEAPALLPDPTGLARNRALRVQAPAPSTAGPAAITALRLRMIELQEPVPPNAPCCGPPDFSAFESSICSAPGELSNCVRWVGKPALFLESQDVPAIGSVKAARLQCTPYYHDWSSEALVYLVGAEVVPSSRYELEQVPASCTGAEAACVADSPALMVATARHGDVAAPFQTPTPPLNQPNGLDVTGLVNAFRHVAGAPSKPTAQLQPNVPDLNADVNAIDIANGVDAFRGFAYAYSGPCPCPSTVPCNSTECSSAAQCTGPHGPGASCVRGCSGGPKDGFPCTANKHCRQCLGGTSDGLPCAVDAECPNGTCPAVSTCGSGFCRDRCGRCN